MGARRGPDPALRPYEAREAAEVDLASVCVDEKDLLGSYSADFTLQDEVARLVFSRKLDVRGLITHRFALESAAEGVRLASRRPRTRSRW